MKREVMEYCYRGIIQHLNGNMNKFYYYVNKAVEAHHNDKNIFTIEDKISIEIKRKLYELVS